MALAEPQPAFMVQVDQSSHLPAGTREVQALITVTCMAPPPAVNEASVASHTSGAEVIIIDCSARMARPGQEAMITHLRRAVTAAVDEIRDGARFAIVAGSDPPRQVYPVGSGLAVAGAGTRAAVRTAVEAGLTAGGRTVVGQWLCLARELLAATPGPFRHAILVIGSSDSPEDVAELDATVAYCQGVFSCDCRGVGTEWQVSELRKISTALLGSIDIVPDPASLPAELASLVRNSMSKRVADVTLEIRTPPAAAVGFVKQVNPLVEDLTSRGIRGDYPTGAWAPGESRDFHVSLDVVPLVSGVEMAPTRVRLVVASARGGQVCGEGLIRAVGID